MTGALSVVALFDLLGPVVEQTMTMDCQMADLRQAEPEIIDDDGRMQQLQWRFDLWDRLRDALEGIISALPARDRGDAARQLRLAEAFLTPVDELVDDTEVRAHRCLASALVVIEREDGIELPAWWSHYYRPLPKTAAERPAVAS